MSAIPLEQEMEYPTSDGQPMAETTLHRKIMADLIEALERHFAGVPDVWVGGNLFLCYRSGSWRPGKPRSNRLRVETPQYAGKILPGAQIRGVSLHGRRIIPIRTPQAENPGQERDRKTAQTWEVCCRAFVAAGAMRRPDTVHPAAWW